MARLPRSLALLSAAIFALSACSETARPTEAELAAAIHAETKKKGVSKAEARCMARVLVTSDLSNGTVRAAMDTGGRVFDEPDRLPAQDRQVLNNYTLIRNFTGCTNRVKQSDLEKAAQERLRQQQQAQNAPTPTPSPADPSGAPQ